MTLVLEALEQMILDQCERYPEVMAQDIYLAVYQWVVGPGPTPLLDWNAPWKAKEGQSDWDFTPKPWEDPLEWLDASRALARIHLRPYLRAGGDLRKLQQAVLQTSSLYEEQHQALALWFQRARLFLLKQDLEFSEIVMEEFEDLIYQGQRQGFPHPKHSDAFVEAYEPLYWVVNVNLLTPSSIF